jgi:hypothetical protein
MKAKEKKMNIKECFLDLSESEAQEVASLIKEPQNGRIAEETMVQLNLLLEGYGVEVIKGEWIDSYSYYHDIIATYVNLGDDLYVVTVVHNSESGEYEVIDLGTWMERKLRGEDAILNKVKQ